MSELNDFARDVLAMRAAQRDYFKKPITGKLIAAKALEKKVDDQLDSMLGIQLLKFPDELTPEEIPY